MIDWIPWRPWCLPHSLLKLHVSSAGFECERKQRWDGWWIQRKRLGSQNPNAGVVNQLLVSILQLQTLSLCASSWYRVFVSYSVNLYTAVCCFAEWFDRGRNNSPLYGNFLSSAINISCCLPNLKAISLSKNCEPENNRAQIDVVHIQQSSDSYHTWRAAINFHIRIWQTTWFVYYWRRNILHLCAKKKRKIIFELTCFENWRPSLRCVVKLEERRRNSAGL